MSRLQPGDALLHAHARRRHPVDEIEVVLARERVAHADVLADDAVGLDQKDIEGGQLAVDAAQHEPRLSGHVLHHLAEVVGRHLVEGAVVRLAVGLGLLEQRDQLVLDAVDRVANLDLHVGGAPHFLAQIRAHGRREARQIFALVLEGQVQRRERQCGDAGEPGLLERIVRPEVVAVHDVLHGQQRDLVCRGVRVHAGEQGLECLDALGRRHAGRKPDRALLGQRRAHAEHGHDDELGSVFVEPFAGRLEGAFQRKVEPVVGAKQHHRGHQSVARIGAHRRGREVLGARPLAGAEIIPSLGPVRKQAIPILAGNVRDARHVAHAEGLAS